MSSDVKLMDMLTAYAAAHQHPFNIFVHLIGIPIIMLGVLIPLTWVSIGQGATEANLGHVLVFGFFLFYMTLDRIFAIVFLFLALLLTELAMRIGAMPVATSGAIAAAAFFGGYALQFVGHAVENNLDRRNGRGQRLGNRRRHPVVILVNNFQQGAEVQLVGTG